MITNKPIIIALVGRKRSGKTMLADSLILHTKNAVSRVSFASPMRETLISWGVPRSLIVNKDCWNTPQPDFDDHTIRQMMQAVGAFGRNSILRTMWVNIAMVNLERDIGQRQHPAFIFDDVRHPNEFDALKAMGAKMVAVNREQVDHDDDPHESEIQIPALKLRCDTQLNNSGNIDVAIVNLRTLYRNIKKEQATMTREKNCFCYACEKHYHSLGIARHRAMHRDNEQDCIITYACGTTVNHKFNFKKKEQAT